MAEYQDEDDELLQRVYSRRFGPGYPKPCLRPHVIECALWRCQKQNQCYLTPTTAPKAGDRARD